MNLDDILRILFFLWILFVPQLLGLLIYFRLPLYPRAGHLLGTLTTIILSFFYLMMIFGPRTDSDRQVCGLGVLAFLIILGFFMTIQIFFCAVGQAVLYRRYTRMN